MPIDSHKNPELADVPGRGEPGGLAAGSSNSNSHNRTSADIGDIGELVSQLSRVLPRLEEIASRGPGK